MQIARIGVLLALPLVVTLFACNHRSGSLPDSDEKEAQEAVVSSKTVLASYYGPKFHDKTTASGEVFDQNALTAAHRTLPFDTRVRVTHVKNEKSVVVRINDRGPHITGREIDLSAGAARKIGLEGVEKVKLVILPKGTQ